jgi:hypothetical protein
VAAMKDTQLKNSCPKCEFIDRIFKGIKDMSNREYWIMTEVFVHLHDGKDFCNFITTMEKGTKMDVLNNELENKE